MTRIVTPQNRRSRATRAGLLDEAWRLLEHTGATSLTMSDVADAAGVSRQGMYLHFPSRAQLFIDLIEHVDSALDLESSLRPILEAPDALTALDAFCEHVARYHSRLIVIVRAIDRSRDLDEDAAAMWEQFTAKWYDGCRSVTERLAEEDRLAEPWTPVTAADLMWALMSVEFVDDLTGERGWTIDDLTARLQVLARRTLCGVDR